MSRICTICNHKDREKINFDLMAHEITYESVAKKYGISHSCVKRHVTNHLMPLVKKINREKEKTDEAIVLNARSIYMEIMKRLPTVIDQTSVKEVLRAAEGYARISGEDVAPVQNIYVWGKGLERDDDMEITNDLRGFEIVKTRDGGEEAEVEAKEAEQDPEADSSAPL